MLEQTLQHLDEHGFVEDGKVKRSRLTERLRENLIADVVDAEAEIMAKAKTVAELREPIIPSHGDDEVNKELDTLTGSLLGIRSDAPVQKKLENGHVLCSVKVQRVMVDGEPPKTKQARFVSGQPEIVNQYARVVVLDAAVKKVQNAHRLGEMVERRVPALGGTVRTTLYQGYHQQLALALPIPNGQ